MPSEASREALTELAAGLLTEELVDDRYLPGTDDSPPDPLMPHDLLTPPDPLTASASLTPPAPPTPAERAERGAAMLGQIVDVFVGSRRLANWALWLQLAAAAHLIDRWQSSPPIVDGALPDLETSPTTPAGALARRLWRVVAEVDIWGPLDTGDLAEEFVAAEISAAAGLSHYGAAQAVDTARTLFMTSRLPRTRQLLRAGLLDWNKLRTIMITTQTLDDQVCQLVEAVLIPAADLAVADPLDTLADPASPGRNLPAVARLTNPALQAKLIEAIAAIDAAAAARRASKARRERYVAGKPLPHAMGRLEITTGQEDVAAVLAGLDHAVAAAKHAGDTRTADQIRTDHAIHLLTDGAHGTDAYPADDSGDEVADTSRHVPGDSADDSAHGPAGDSTEDPADDTGGARSAARAGRRGRAKTRRRRYGRRGLQVRLTIPLGTWLGLADDPAVLDGYGPLPAALARQIAAEAARDHPTTTTWRCVVVHNQHATVLGVGDVIPTPRYTPTNRQKAFVQTADTFCVYPGCRTQAWRCDIDHRRPYNHDNPAAGGPTCTCNLHSLCRRHHRLKTAGLITPHPAETRPGHVDEQGEQGEAPRPDPAAVVLGEIPGNIPPGSLDWTTWTGRRYRYQPPRATPAPADPETVAACATRSERPGHQDPDQHLAHPGTAGPTSETAGPTSETGGTGGTGGTNESRQLASADPALAHWDRARRRLLEREALRNARRARRGARDHTTWQEQDPDAPPPF